jgi:hypothetical protein
VPKFFQTLDVGDLGRGGNFFRYFRASESPIAIACSPMLDPDNPKRQNPACRSAQCGSNQRDATRLP